MKGRLTAIKNIAWALAILLCLLAVFIGLLFAAFTRNSGEQFRGGVQLGVKTASSDDTASDSATRPPVTGDGTLRVLAETEDAGQEYVDALTFLCDSTLIGLRNYGILKDGEATAQVWATPSGVLAVSDIPESRIVFPNDGSIVTAANAAMILQPRILVISVGNDGIANVDQYDFIDKYETLIESIQKASPQTWILCIPPTSATVAYADNGGLAVTKSNEAREWLKTICTDTGAYYCDAVSSVQDVSGMLLQEFASADGVTLNSSGLNQLLQYLRYHAVS